MNINTYYMYKQAADIGSLLFGLNNAIGKGSKTNIPNAIAGLITRITRANPNISQTQALQYLRETAGRFKYDSRITGALDRALERLGASALEQGKVDQNLFNTINSISNAGINRKNFKSDVKALSDKIGGGFPWLPVLGIGGGVTGVGALGALGYYSRNNKEKKRY